MHSDCLQFETNAKVITIKTEIEPVGFTMVCRYVIMQFSFCIRYDFIDPELNPKSYFQRKHVLEHQRDYK